MNDFDWIQERHLDLPTSLSLVAAQHELSRLSEFRSPRDKLTLLLNCSRIVAELVKKSFEQNAGNDYLLPTLILVILRAKPMNLISHVKYTMRYRNQAKVNEGVAQFCLTNMVCLIMFIHCHRWEPFLSFITSRPKH